VTLWSAKRRSHQARSSSADSPDENPVRNHTMAERGQLEGVDVRGLLDPPGCRGLGPIAMVVDAAPSVLPVTDSSRPMTGWPSANATTC
jgi:hypothetical protein